MRRIAIDFIALTLLACGATTKGGVRRGIPVHLELRTTAGATIDTVTFRGKPLLLFLFATFDGASQAALTTLRTFVKQYPDIAVVGVAVQPHADGLIAAWEHALDPPFPIAFDPHGHVVADKSALGEIEAVPTYVWLDAKGRILRKSIGFHPQRLLEATVFELYRPGSGSGGVLTR